MIFSTRRTIGVIETRSRHRKGRVGSPFPLVRISIGSFAKSRSRTRPGKRNTGPPCSDWYSAAPHFAQYKEFFKDIYLGNAGTNLSVLNQFLIQAIARDFLGIRTEFADSRSYAPVGTKQDRLIDLLKKAGASWYLAGPAAKDYIEPERFADAGIELTWQSYAGYPEYQQRFPPFEHGVSIVDLSVQYGTRCPGVHLGMARIVMTAKGVWILVHRFDDCVHRLRPARAQMADRWGWSTTSRRRRTRSCFCCDC